MSHQQPEWSDPEFWKKWAEAAKQLGEAATASGLAANQIKKLFPKKKATKQDLDELAKTVQGIIDTLFKAVTELTPAVVVIGKIITAIQMLADRELHHEREVRKAIEAIVATLQATGNLATSIAPPMVKAVNDGREFEKRIAVLESAKRRAAARRRRKPASKDAKRK